MKKRRMKIFYMMAMSTVIATTGVTGTMGTLRVSAAEIQKIFIESFCPQRTRRKEN